MLSLLLWIYALLLLLQVGFYVSGFFALDKIAQKLIPSKLDYEPITVLVCARNEQANLPALLAGILKQSYPADWELLLVDDNSTDESWQMLTQAAAENPRLRLLRLREKLHGGKKAALVAGVKAARYGWVLLTDADCQPNSDQWIKKMMAAGLADPKTEIVLGFSPYEEKNGWLSGWIGYETALTALQYLSFAAWGRAYMGVGRNLMYKKSLFLSKDYFQDSWKIRSGDDDLFINQAATGENVQVCLSPDSFCVSRSVDSWAGLYRQKTRHFSASGHYKLRDKISLGLLAQSHFWSHWGLGLVWIAEGWAIWLLAGWLLRLLLVGLLMRKLMKSRLGYTKNLGKILAFDLAVTVYYAIFAATFATNKNTIRWK